MVHGDTKQPTSNRGVQVGGWRHSPSGLPSARPPGQGKSILIKFLPCREAVPITNDIIPEQRLLHYTLFSEKNPATTLLA
jgi:hypothetical protein